MGSGTHDPHCEMVRLLSHWRVQQWITAEEMDKIGMDAIPGEMCACHDRARGRRSTLLSGEMEDRKVVWRSTIENKLRIMRNVQQMFLFRELGPDKLKEFGVIDARNRFGKSG